MSSTASSASSSRRRFARRAHARELGVGHALGRFDRIAPALPAEPEEDGGPMDEPAGECVEQVPRDPDQGNRDGGHANESEDGDPNHSNRRW